jgi:MtN3 and saliva related transmembrane protein
VNPAFTEFVGTVAALLTTTAFFPQAIKTLRTRETGGLSLTMYLLLVMGVTMWLLYGLMIGSRPLIVANGVVLMPQAAILILLVQQIWRTRSRPRL